MMLETKVVHGINQVIIIIIIANVSFCTEFCFVSTAMHNVFDT